MRTITLKAVVDENRRLLADAPASVPPGPVQVTLNLPSADEDDAAEWSGAIASSWAADWSDPREDIYSLSDGEAVDEGR